MKVQKSHVALGVLASGLLLAGSALAQSVTIPVDQARTYCHTPALELRTNASIAPGSPASVLGLQVRTTDAGIVGPGGNEVVFQVVGTLGDTSQPGEAYCGFLGLGQAGIPVGGGVVIGSIQDCIGVLRYNIPAAPAAPAGAASANSAAPGTLAIQSARLKYAGARIGGVYHSMAVTVCRNQPGPSAVDNEPLQGGGPTDPDPDCIVTRDDLAGGSFAGIHDIMNRRADNNVGLVGGASNLNRNEAFVVRNLELSGAAVAWLNARTTKSVSFVVRCADSGGSMNGFTGGDDNVLILHDPAGFGFGGPFGDIPLEITY